MFEKLAIVGVGLIGGSLARAVKAKGLVSTIVGLGRGEVNLLKAVELGVIDVMETDLIQGVAEADLIVLATPVSSLEGLVGRIAPYIRKDAIITDVGSVKGSVVREAEKHFKRPVRFVGGHPIAGTEHSGVEASFATLFEHRTCILTPTENTDPGAVERVKGFWEAVGSQVVNMGLDEHDRIMGFVSHLPHIVAYALVNTVEGAEREEGDLLGFSAGGFRDFTRIASSHPEMWRDICLMNRDVLLESIQAFGETLEEFKQLISLQDGKGLQKQFNRSRRTRALLLEEEDE